MPGRAHTQRTQTTWNVPVLKLLVRVVPLARFTPHAVRVLSETDEPDQKTLAILASVIQLVRAADLMPWV